MMDSDKALLFARTFKHIEGLSTFTSTFPLQCTLYLNKMELVCLDKSPYLEEYTVYINRPYWEKGKEGFITRKQETEKQYIFLETKSWNIAFNMVKRIVEQRKYPRVKIAW